jgi:thioredoxin reductase
MTFVHAPEFSKLECQSLTQQQHYDVAIIGAGPAGLQAALVLARTRKRLIVFDAPEPPRNAVSHGVHNFVGFSACYGYTIIPCPFCDGYENRDRLWGMVASDERSFEHMPMLFRHWTNRALLIAAPHLLVSEAQRDALAQHGVAFYQGEIVEVHHTAGSVEAVTLSTGERVTVETLWWHPGEAPLPLTEQIIGAFQLEQDSDGHIKTDAAGQTSHVGLWAVGDVLGWAGALGAAHAANTAASAIVRGWYA